ncbi:traD domain protein [Escherichia coli DEC11C]|uniref:DNA transport protein TraD n=2 Tax=Enterobacteriaceae TaxID=543 RepID=A0A0K2YQJ6_ECOLX|nr:DNA transport protein TraD [Salmonella enterica subsp. enterica serovar Typhimurium]EFZ66602.1 protein traD domain protein [Escherichia coli OK1180]EHV27055.1 traD domain protein [Escherichia coli DEC5B]EHW71624.1 traD domain protein [Escherichia coli DEC10D]EHX00768.1 traD domain protein [Escherichia coli DEC11C]EHX55731.1 traD domain protein [Escherichia coli DEC13D]EIQ36347.1 traD domain protein [Shigella boydii 965-58]EJE76041.1 conjugal transfer protein TraD [Escherichia coli O111:H8
MSFNAKDMTQGGQIASMRIRMFSQIANIMLYCLFIFSGYSLVWFYG